MPEIGLLLILGGVLLWLGLVAWLARPSPLRQERRPARPIPEDRAGLAEADAYRTAGLSRAGARQ
jgi:hypothetical protein